VIPIVIRGDRGGSVLKYYLRIQYLIRSNLPVIVDGACMSACTLYLSIPIEQICITKRASFSFHKPYGAGPHGNQEAEAFMLRQYPRWVINWIKRVGGLTKSLKTMQNYYARHFMRAC
jgi:hypothetical protein